MFTCGFFTYQNEKQFDYTYYLGPNYKNTFEERGIKKASTIVSNHVGWLDSVILYCNMNEGVSFSASSDLAKIPILGQLINGNNMLLMARGGDEA